MSVLESDPAATEGGLEMGTEVAEIAGCDRRYGNGVSSAFLSQRMAILAGDRTGPFLLTRERAAWRLAMEP